MKNLKKAIALCLALLLCLTFPVGVSAAEVENATIDTSRTGSLDIYKYDFTEVRTDNGYTLLKDDIEVVISQAEATEFCDIYAFDVLGLIQNDPRYSAIIHDTGDLKNMPQKHLEHHLLTASATVDGNAVTMLTDNGSANAEAPLRVVNTPGFDLPKTGDNGTWWLTICGTLLILCAGGCAILLVTSRRKKNTRQ